MKLWEYEVFGFTDIDGQALQGRMNEMGAEGWEYTGQSVFPVKVAHPADPTQVIDQMLYVYIFKREKSLIQVPKGVLTHG